MKTFHCECGQRLFFESNVCIACKARVGFDPRTLDMVVVDADWWQCSHGLDYGICNWLLPAGDPVSLCRSCRLTDVIPRLDAPGNLQLWGRMEAAKRRLLYNLLSLRLPIEACRSGPGLRFRFLEDQRRNPDVLEEFVNTGHQAGTITLNLREADDVERTAEREAMQERYRTLLGHFRHESAHYYFNVLVGEAERTRWRELFGDETDDYAASLNRYYRDGAPADWSAWFVSSYATAHPHEDWAETFAHYLHIVDALETAHEAGLAAMPADGRPGWILEWIKLSVTLNELNRSLGTEDPYPFVLTAPVIEKLEFIDRLVHRPGGSASDAPAGAATSQTPS